MNADAQSLAFSTQLIALLATLMLVTQLLLVVEGMVMNSIRLFALQSFLLAGVAATIAHFSSATHVYLVALLTMCGKGIFMPWFLARLTRKTKDDRESKPYFNAAASVMLCGGFTLLSYILARPFTHVERMGSSTLAVAITLLLTGFFQMINRRKALSQVLALLTMENGIMLAAIALTTYGMPLIVELGIFFDVIIAVMVLGILVNRIRQTFASMDVSKLTQLKE
ncbi:MAG: hydrogenase [Verrucomicrobiota bacterium]